MPIFFDTGQGRMSEALLHQTILAVDLGTQSLRVSALDTSGNRMWSWSAPVDSHLDGEIFEQNTVQWASLLKSALIEAQRAGIRPDAIAAAGPLAGFVALDAQGQALTPAVMYSDRRPAQDVGQIVKALAGEVSLRPVVSDPLPHWFRLCREQPEVAARTRHFLDATGWLNFFLTGRATLNAYSAMRLYTQALRLRLEADQAPFGDTVSIGEVIGTLTPALGWRDRFSGVPVIAATFDSKCAYIGSGIHMPGQALDISGTVTSFGVVSALPVDDPLQRIYSVPLADQWLVRGSTASSGSTLEWVRAQLMHTDFALLNTAAAGVAPGARGLTFLPYLAGERAPLWNPQARGALLGLSLDNTQADIMRAVFEGLAFSLSHITETMVECGAGIKEVRLAGGLAKNDLLAQIKADVLGVTMVRLSDYELTTLGLAVIASVALKAYPNAASASRCFVKTDRHFTPATDAVQAYADARRRYLSSSAALLPTFNLASDF
ncbi:XylB Sugar (pentulose and hexulose) kinases [Burkholderiaceae bacterium]